jgi:hypothetical protein
MAARTVDSRKHDNRETFNFQIYHYKILSNTIFIYVLTQSRKANYVMITGYIT